MPVAVKPGAVRLRLPYASMEEFIEGYRHHLSRSAAFVATEAPRPVGTPLHFEFVLQGGQALLRGEAVVARQTRPPSRSGMLLRFLALDDDSRELVDRLCPPESAAEAPVLGIDFGNSGARAALVRRGQPEVVRLGRAQATSLPAAVALDARGRLLVGQRAQALTLAEPRRVATGIKRLLGRRLTQQPEGFAARLPFATTADSRGELSAVLGGRLFPMTRLAAEVLRTLREQVQEAKGVPLQRAVFTVPSHFRDRQRAALRRAASEAGFSVEQLLNEASAVAIACGAGRGLARQRLAIVDLGGGSFDCAVVQIEGDEVETLACGGDSRFGGNEFDLRLANLLAERFEAESGAAVVDDAAAFQRLLDGARVVKEALSSAAQAELRLPALAQRDGQPVEFQTTITRGEFEALVADLVERVVHLTGEVLAAAKIAPRDCDELVLVGGLAPMPRLRQALGGLFGRPPRRDLEGESAVACGAALLGQRLAQRQEGLGLRELLSAPLFVELPSGELREVFAGHTPLPAERQLTLEPQPDGCRVRLHQGLPGQAEPLGSLELQGGSGHPQIALTLSADAVLHARLRFGEREQTLEVLSADVRSELPLAVVEELDRPRGRVDGHAPAWSSGGGR